MKIVFANEAVGPAGNDNLTSARHWQLVWRRVVFHLRGRLRP